MSGVQKCSTYTNYYGCKSDAATENKIGEVQKDIGFQPNEDQNNINIVVLETDC